MGLVYVRGICDTLIVITGTPVDGEYVDQMFSYRQRTGDDPKLQRVGRAFLRDLEKQMNEDIVCFEHKRYFLRPLLVEGDGAIGLTDGEGERGAAGGECVKGLLDTFDCVGVELNLAAQFRLGQNGYVGHACQVS